MREEGTPIRNDDNASEKFSALEDGEKEEEAATSTVSDAAFGEKGININDDGVLGGPKNGGENYRR